MQQNSPTWRSRREAMVVLVLDESWRSAGAGWCLLPHVQRDRDAGINRVRGRVDDVGRRARVPGTVNSQAGETDHCSIRTGSSQVAGRRSQSRIIAHSQPPAATSPQPPAAGASESASASGLAAPRRLRAQRAAFSRRCCPPPSVSLLIQTLLSRQHPHPHPLSLLPAQLNRLPSQHPPPHFFLPLARTCPLLSDPRPTNKGVCF